MRVLMLSWEYPPRTIGGLARHVAELSHAMANSKIDVNVVTPGTDNKDLSQAENGVSVHFVQPYSLPSLDFIADIQHLNFSLLEKSIKLINSWGKVDIIHAHDWLVAYAARALKHIYQVPLISTIHAMEYGRNNGLHNDLQRYISSVEWWLTYESWKVIVCSEAMKQEAQNFFQIPGDKIEIINNGIELAGFEPGKDAFRRDKYALPDEKIIFFVGRLVREKGVQILLEAVPKILAVEPKVKFIIAGKGSYEENLKNIVQSLGIENNVNFVGFIEDGERNTLYNYAHAVVFPSLYEPFGIVALEGMATNTPTIVAGTGGLDEIVKHEVNGLKFIPGNSDSLAEQVIRILTDPLLAKKITSEAKKEVINKYSWDGVAQKTLNVYKEIINESRKNASWLPQWVKISKIGRYEM